MTGKQGRALKRKIVIIFLLIGLVPLSVASALSFFSSQKTLKQVIGEGQRDLAIEVMDKINREMDNAMLLVRNWSTMPAVLTAVVTGRKRTFDELHTAWQTDGLTTNSTATLLKNLQATTQNRFKEIFVTDSRGYVIAATNKTSDFDQGSGDDPPFGEPWWAAAQKKGEHIGDIDYDESAEVYSVDINMNITTADGQSAGVIKAVYNMENIQNMKQNRPFIGALSKGETWYYELINQKGLLLATRESERERILKTGPSVKIPKRVWTNLTNPNWGQDDLTHKNGFILGEQEGEKILVGWSRGSDDSQRANWTVLAYLPVNEAYAPLYPLIKWCLTVSLVALVVILAISLTFANRVVQVLVHREILSQELQVAHDTQMGLLPEAPEVKGLDLAGKCMTANSVGGDYYNYLWLDKAETQLAIVVGDVAGHDMSAAIPAVMFSGMLEYAIQEQTPGAMLCTLNEILCRRLRRTPFITCCIGVIDLVAKTLVWSKAGHPEIYHYRKQTAELVPLPMDSYPLGISPKSQYTDGAIELGIGDMLVFHTDGLAEACNQQEEMYGYLRMEQCVLEIGQDNVSSIGGINRMVADAHRFMENQEQADDITLVIAKVTG